MTHSNRSGENLILNHVYKNISKWFEILKSKLEDQWVRQAYHAIESCAYESKFKKAKVWSKKKNYSMNIQWIVSSKMPNDWSPTSIHSPFFAKNKKWTIFIYFFFGQLKVTYNILS